MIEISQLTNFTAIVFNCLYILISIFLVSKSVVAFTSLQPFSPRKINLSFREKSAFLSVRNLQSSSLCPISAMQSQIALSSSPPLFFALLRQCQRYSYLIATIRFSTLRTQKLVSVISDSPPPLPLTTHIAISKNAGFQQGSVISLFQTVRFTRARLPSVGSTFYSMMMISQQLYTLLILGQRLPFKLLIPLT